MKRTLLVLGMVLALAMSTMAGAIAGGPADKATGDVDWQRNGELRTADFNAHEERERRPAKGELWQMEYDFDGTLAASIYVPYMEYVEIDGYTACFAGIAETATGSYDGFAGQYRVTVVVDGGTPGTEGDQFAGRFVGDTISDFAAACASVGSNDVTSGNLQVHVDGADPA